MKILLYTDPHISTNSSIVTGKMDGQEHPRYSARLDKCISTFNWINKIATDNKVDQIICLGDLVDQSKLSAEELSAIGESHIESHTILIGNHDVSSLDGYFNSCNLYGRAIISPQVIKYDDFNLVYLPWSKEIVDLNRLCEGLSPDRTIILSHNDLKGIYYGNYMSQYGYDIRDILQNCNLFINGHLHVGKWIQKNRIMNLGTITGLNFNNVGGWTGFALMIDTSNNKFKLTWFENPYAFIFYDSKITSRLQLSDFMRSLDKTRFNVIQLRVPKNLVDVTRDTVERNKSICFSRILTLHEKVTLEEGEEVIEEKEEIAQSGLSIYDSLREFIEKNCPTKYDKESVMSEVNKLEVGEL